MMRKLTEQEERQIQYCYAVASRLEQLGQVEAAQSERQRAQNLRHRYEHDNETIEGIFNHRTDEAMQYVSHRLLRNDLKPKCEDAAGDVECTIIKTIPENMKTLKDGTPIDYVNQDVDSLCRYYVKGKLVAEIYPAGEGQFAVRMPPRTIGKKRKKQLEEKDVLLTDNYGRVVTPTGMAYELFMLDETNSNSLVEIPFADGKTVHDLWIYALEHTAAKEIIC